MIEAFSFDQHGFSTRFDWGPDGLARIGPGAEVVVIVDVLRFSTAVCVINERGAAAVPTGWNADTAGFDPASLSPVALRAAVPGSRVELASINGSALTLAAVAAGVPVVLAGSLRNAHAVGRYARSAARDGVVAVIAAGERDAEGGLRPGVEDLLGAGAVAASAGGDPSPEAAAAMAAWAACGDVERALLTCVGGRELVAAGGADDVVQAAAINVSGSVPLFVGGAFEDAAAS